ncbi:MAG: hypothetical protein QM733_20580 [Ilumatobacteraceae bacterium]
MELLRRFLNQEHLTKRWQNLLDLPACDRPVVDKPPAHRQHRLSEALQQEVIQRYQAGESVYTLAAAYDVHRGTVSAILKRHGVNRRYNLLSQEQLNQAAELYRSGRSLAQIGKTMGVSAKTIHSALRRLGVPMRAVGTNQWQ